MIARDATRKGRSGRRASRLGLALVVLMVGFPSVGSAPTSAAASSCALSGNGDQNSPYLVSEPEHLALIGVGACGLGAWYEQTASLTLPTPTGGATSNHVPIGTSTDPFTGVYDGRDLAIDGLAIDSTSDMVGLFGRANNARFVDVRIVEGSIVTSGVRVGALVGYAENGTSIEGAFSSASVTGAGLVGGLLGHGYNSVLVEGAEVSGRVNAQAATGSAGGLVGFMESGGRLADSAFRGTVQGGTNIGGAVGAAQGNADIRRVSVSSAAGVTVTGSGNRVGGLVGWLRGTAKVLESFSAAHVEGGSAAGGLVGFMDGDTEISWSSALGDVVGGTNVGGLVGQVVEPSGTLTIFSASASGAVSGTSSVGGLVGQLSGAGVAVIESFATGAVTAPRPGGFSVGGLVGLQDLASISDSYARGGVSGEFKIGGLVGMGRGTVTRTFATGAVVGDSHRGGLVGRLSIFGGTLTVTDSFWDSETSGLTTSVGGTAKSTLEMKTFATYTDTATAGLDTAWPIAQQWMPNVSPPRLWALCADENGGYPQLQRLLDEDSCQTTGGQDDPVTLTASTLGTQLCDGGGAIVALPDNVLDTTETLTIADDCTATLDLNGATLAVRNVVLGAGSTLTIRDTNDATNGFLRAEGAVFGVAGIRTAGATLRVESGVVVGNGGATAAGIGGDGLADRDGGTVEITGGSVQARGGMSAAGIGGGFTGAGGTVTISGGTVDVFAGSSAAAIGGGSGGDGGTITITGGAVIAEGTGLDPIGPGSGGSPGTVTIGTGGSRCDDGLFAIIAFDGSGASCATQDPGTGLDPGTDEDDGSGPVEDARVDGSPTPASVRNGPLGCAPAVVRPGASVECTIAGGTPGSQLAWRAAFNPTFAGDIVTLDSAGAGAFRFTVPAAAAGRPIMVELVDLEATVVLASEDGPVPTSVPAGQGPPAVPSWLVNLVSASLALALLLAARVLAPGGGAARVRSSGLRG